VTEPDAVALADRVAAVSEATADSVAPVGMPVPLIGLPLSSALKVFAAAVRAAEALVVVTVTERGSGLRPATISQRPPLKTR
jgi:hypothetical protein